MVARRGLLVGFAAAVSLLAGIVYAQDSPSLGDLARQQRQQRAQLKAAQAKDAKAPRVITNEEIPEHRQSAVAPASRAEESGTATPDSSSGAKQPAGQVKSRIQAQENQIASLQEQIDELNESIRFAPANCVANCVQWNERQREKQQQVERMQAQVEDQKKHLEEMQDSARKQGYGSSVYDP
ncbi:MAG: hypothetical protein WAM69_14270 [Candidatus Sulfotelmatobacter sp.]